MKKNKKLPKSFSIEEKLYESGCIEARNQDRSFSSYMSAILKTDLKRINRGSEKKSKLIYKD